MIFLTHTIKDLYNEDLLHFKMVVDLLLNLTTPESFVQSLSEEDKETAELSFNDINNLLNDVDL
jgi:hypothetical protein